MRYSLIAIFVAFISSLAASAPARAAVVAWYRFEDGTAGAAAGAIADSSGNGLVGVGVNGPVYSSSVGLNPLPGGIPNHLSMSFDGNQRIFVPDYPVLALTHSLTVEALINLSSTPYGKEDVVFRGDDRGGFDPYNLYVDNSGQTLGFLVTDAANNSAVLTTPVPTNQWIDVAGTLDDATGSLRLYVNGTLAAIAITPIRPFATLQGDLSPGLGIGGLQSGNPSLNLENFNGLIDEVRIADTALPPGQLLVPEPSLVLPLVIGGLGLLSCRRSARCA